MKRILVTGSNGQLGSEIRKISKIYTDYIFIFTDIEELDITKVEDIEKIFNETEIDICINCVAYTAVNKSTDEPEKAFLLNATAVDNLSKVCKKNNTLLIHFSTDYVFEGTSSIPYKENYIALPKNVYGLSKLSGERIALNNSKKVIVIRTSWLYSTYGSNFVKNILNLFSKNEQIEVVNDQIGTPTFAGDLAKVTLDIIIKVGDKPIKEIYNYSNEGVASWYDFAMAIKELSGSKCRVLPVDSSKFSTKADRPHYSVLDKTKIKNDFNIEIPYWRDSLKLVIDDLI